MAQAETAYRAALDAVRAEASTAHQQWHRGVRRDTYAAFLLATTRSVQAASAIPEQSALVEDLAAAAERLRQERSDLTAALWAVRLEGPDEVAEIADRLCVLIIRLIDGLVQRAERRRAQSELDSLADDSVDDGGQRADRLPQHQDRRERAEGLLRRRSVRRVGPLLPPTPGKSATSATGHRERGLTSNNAVAATALGCRYRLATHPLPLPLPATPIRPLTCVVAAVAEVADFPEGGAGAPRPESGGSTCAPPCPKRPTPSPCRK